MPETDKKIGSYWKRVTILFYKFYYSSLIIFPKRKENTDKIIVRGH